MESTSSDMSTLPERHIPDALREVVDAIEQFLLQQVDRVEQHSQTVSAATSPRRELGDVDDMLTQFEQSRSEWQRQYECQKRELEEDCQRLTEAWERIENEQRQMLAQRSIQQTISRTSVENGDPSDLRNKTPASLTPANGAKAKPATNRDPASLTFKQLQQQIRTHGKRRK
jgi:hypothetical protein